MYMEIITIKGVHNMSDVRWLNIHYPGEYLKDAPAVAILSSGLRKMKLYRNYPNEIICEIGQAYWHHILVKKYSKWFFIYCVRRNPTCFVYSRFFFRYENMAWISFFVCFNNFSVYSCTVERFFLRLEN